MQGSIAPVTDPTQDDAIHAHAAEAGHYEHPDLRVLA